MFGDKLTCISGVDLHGLEPVVGCKFRARPLPDASQLSMTGESVAILDDWGGVPVFEADVAVVELNKHRQRLARRMLYRLVVGSARP